MKKYILTNKRRKPLNIECNPPIRLAAGGSTQITEDQRGHQAVCFHENNREIGIAEIYVSPPFQPQPNKTSHPPAGLVTKDTPSEEIVRPKPVLKKKKAKKSRKSKKKS